MGVAEGVGTRSRPVTGKMCDVEGQQFEVAAVGAEEQESSPRKHWIIQFSQKRPLKINTEHNRFSLNRDIASQPRVPSLFREQRGVSPMLI